MNTLLRMATASALALAVASPAAATTLARLDTEQMVDASDAIVRGTVVSTWSMLDEQNYAWTRVNVRVTDTLKGETASTVTVESPGAVINGVVHDVPLAARYSVGEEVLLFLTEKPHREVYGTVAMYGGKYTVRQNPADGSEMVVLFTLPYDRAYNAEFIPHPPVGERLGYAAFADRIRSRVQAGWDGRSIPGISDEKLRTINRLQPGVK